MLSTALNLEPSQYLAGWKPEAGRLFVPALSDSRLGSELAVRIGIVGRSMCATLFGKVASVRRMGRPSLPPGVELTLDRGSLPAARFLAMAARGEQVSFQERAPRFAAERRLLLERLSPVTEMEVKALNVSEGGCAIEWPGPALVAGEILRLKLRGSLFTSTLQAVVCWGAVADSGPSTAGLRVVTKGLGGRAWRALVSDVARSGGREA